MDELAPAGSPAAGSSPVPAPLAAASPTADAPAAAAPDATPGVETVAAAAAPPDTSNVLEFFDPGGLPQALALIVGAIVAVRLVKHAANRLAERTTKRRLLVQHGHSFLSFTLYGVAFVLALSSVVNLSPQALLALGGTLAVAAGLALKDVAASFLAGISILTNKPFQVGDRISFGGYYGEVREIGLRTVRLVTLDDNLVTIPTTRFLSEIVASANAGALDCMVVIPFFIAPTNDVALAKRLIVEGVIASKYLYLGKPYTVVVQNVLSEDTAVVALNAKAYVYDTRHEKAFLTDVTERVSEAFRAAGIVMPGAPAEAAASRSPGVRAP